MAIDSSLAIRRAMLALLKGSAPVTALVPAVRIYPQAAQVNPVYPFIRMGAPFSTPIRSACVDGGATTIAVHAFANPREDGGQEVETAEDHAHRIGAATAAALDGQRIILPAGSARILWTGSQLLQDPEEASIFHSVSNYLVRAITG